MTAGQRANSAARSAADSSWLTLFSRAAIFAVLGLVGWVLLEIIDGQGRLVALEERQTHQGQVIDVHTESINSLAARDHAAAVARARLEQDASAADRARIRLGHELERMRVRFDAALNGNVQ